MAEGKINIARLEKKLSMKPIIKKTGDIATTIQIYITVVLLELSEELKALPFVW